ncbi:hypothetical protein BK138_16085 [Paenibacillus rhizosphaerae]|uniref:Uncharacterized protein n=1 Tax=Paenibacillus rhizosphaerae TaxID=297318 RepID=A0A1R1ESA5_9BACL|nr:hypothetical protein BK138_16085 [Paenibacillus rhizosphaerae]
MTYKEISAAISGKQRQLKNDLQTKATLVYRLGTLVAYGVNQPKDYPAPHEAFPGIFEEPKTRQQNWQVMKERIEAYAAERRKRGEKLNGNDT